jgi:ubiquitin C-terminal hydrolase
MAQGRTAEGGHYVSWIKKSTGQWYKFDDDKVVHPAHQAKRRAHGLTEQGR